jgi:hypothetical protein
VTDDIVERLRNAPWTTADDCNEAADEIERLQKECFHLAANQCHSGYAGEYGHHRCSEIDRLTKERDEARRKICKIESEAICDPPRSPQKYAILMGWDCFKEER